MLTKSKWDCQKKSRFLRRPVGNVRPPVRTHASDTFSTFSSARIDMLDLCDLFDFSSARIDVLDPRDIFDIFDFRARTDVRSCETSSLKKFRNSDLARKGPKKA